MNIYVENFADALPSDERIAEVRKRLEGAGPRLKPSRTDSPVSGRCETRVHPPTCLGLRIGHQIRLASVALLWLAALISAAPVEAQSVSSFLSNFGQGQDSDTFSRGVRAQSFNTGWDAGRITLHSIDVRVESASTIPGSAQRRFSMYLCPITAEGFPPVRPAEIPAHTACVALTPPSSFAGDPATLTFTAPANTHLQRGTRYIVVNIATSGTPLYDATLSDSEDGDSANGWAIGNGYVWYNSHPNIRRYVHIGTKLIRHQRGRIEVVPVTGPNQALRITIKGTVNNGPTSSDKTVTTNEGSPYRFVVADFPFTGLESSDRLWGVKITSLPSAGELKLGTTPVTANQVIRSSDLDTNGNRLGFTPAANAHGDSYANFTYMVMSGETTESAGGYTMTVAVTPVNDAATGKPTISGPALVGRSLTAATASIADIDGLSATSSFTYQWIRVDGSDQTDIAGATAGTYTLAAADEGKKVKVKVSFTDNDGTVETLPSDAYPSSGTVAMSVVNAAPTASDKTVTTNEDTAYAFDAADFNFADTDTGNTLSSVKIVTLPASDEGTLKLDTTAVTVQQSVSKADLDADKLTFTPTTNDNGQARFTFKVSDGTDESASAYAMTVDVTAVNDAATGAPTIFGGSWVGQTITALTSGIADIDGLPGRFTYQWVRVDGTNETDIAGATAGTYTLAAADEGKTVKVKVSFTDNDGTVETLTSEAFPSSDSVEAATTQSPDDIWSATLRVHHTRYSAGCNSQSSSGKCTSQLNDRDFTLAGDRYTFHRIALSYRDAFHIKFEYEGNFSPAEIRNLTLYVDGASFPINTGELGVGGRIITWENSGIPFSSWYNGKRVRFRLTGPKASTPSAPRSLVATGADRKVNLTWSAPEINGGGGISDYEYRYSEGASVAEDTPWISAGKDLKERVTGLTNGTAYVFEVRAVNRAGKSTAVTATGTPIAAACSAPALGGRHVVWSSKVNVASGSYFYGYDDTHGGSLDDSSLDFGVHSYVVDGAFVWLRESTSDSLVLSFTRQLPRSLLAKLTFHVCDSEGFALADARRFGSYHYRWDNSGLDWSDVTERTLYLSIPVASCAAPALGDQRQVWTGKVKVATHPEFFGYDGTRGGSLENPSFSVGDHNNTVDGAFVQRGTKAGKLILSFGSSLWTRLRSRFTFHVCDDEFALSNTTNFGPNHYRWNDDTGFDWSELLERTLYLSQPANNAATGMPTIMGTATVGQTLTASNSGITDTDGLPSSFAYQWVRVDGSDETDISGATSGTYTLIDDDDGKKIKVVVSFTDDFGGEETVTSDVFPSSDTVQPRSLRSVTNTAPTASNNRVTTAEDTVYTFSATDFNFDDTDKSDTLSSVKIATLPVVGKLTLDGKAVTEIQSVTKADLDVGKLKFTPAANANGDDYASFEFMVNDGVSESVSAYTMTVDVTAVNDPATGKPTIEGTTAVGQTLTASTSDIADADGKTKAENGDTGFVYTYQWVRVDGSDETDISGATSSTYTLTNDDVDKTLKVVVSFADDFGGEETVTSDAFPSSDTVQPRSLRSVTNTAPTASNNTVTTAEDTAYTFSATDFNFADTDIGNTLSSVKIATLPVVGKLTLDGKAVTEIQSVTKADLDANKLTFTPAENANGDDYASFEFMVNDGVAESALAYTMTVDVTAVNDLATGKPTIEGTAAVGQTLTAKTTGIADVDGLTGVAYDYQWVLVDAENTETDIAGATVSAYTLTDEDVSNTLKVKVHFTDDEGTAEGPLTSDAYPSSGTVVAEGACAVPDLVGREAVWEATLTMNSPSVGEDTYGYGFLPPKGGLSDTDFRLGTNDYRVGAVFLFDGFDADEFAILAYDAGTLLLSLNRSLSAEERANLVLHVCGQAFALSGSRAQRYGDEFDYYWTDSGVDWSSVTERTLRISRPMAQSAADEPVLSVADAAAAEGGTLAFQVTLKPAVAAPVTVAYATADGTAAAGSDYTAVSGSLTFTAGETEKTVEVVVTADSESEQAETLTLTLSSPLGATLGDADATGTVTDAASAAALTASFSSVPPEHDGSTAFTLQLAFSEEPPGLSYRTVQESLFTVTGGGVTKASRLSPPSNRRFELTIAPSSNAAMTFALASLPACGETGSVCMADGRALTGPVSLTVPGPVSVSVVDASVQEGPDGTLAFAVTLNRARHAEVTVDYATSDGTAAAGSDYTATSGTLTFVAGEVAKTVSVAVLDDVHDEASETLTLTLSNPTPNTVRLADSTATGTISNTDAMPEAWIARFGRTVSEQVIGAVEGRFAAQPAAGFEVTLAGERIVSGGTDPETRDEAESWARLQGRTDEADQARYGWRSMTPRELLTSSSFTLSAGGDGSDGVVSLWGRGSVSNFDGRDGDLSLDGEVVSGILGTDWRHGPWMSGLLLSHSSGDGSYRSVSGDGEVKSTLTGVYPYGRYEVNPRFSVWGVAGYGTGSLTLTPKGQKPIETDMDLAMTAVGLRGVALEAPAEGGVELAVNSDAMAVRTTSAEVRGTAADGIGNLAAGVAHVTRLRIGLEGTWRGLKVGDGEVTPGIEIGVRHDGGDAETGFGLDVGAGLTWSNPNRGVQVEVRGRGLLTHESKDFRERGLFGSFAWEPEQGTGLGPKLTLTQTLGGPASGGADALLGRETLAGLTANDNGDEMAQRRFEARFGYGFYAFGDRFTSTPEISFNLSNTDRDYSLGWRLVRDAGDGVSLEFSFEARHESANEIVGLEHAMGFRFTAPF